MSHYQGSLRLSGEVRNAIEAKKPIVALESTILCHGMPYPQNLQTAVEVENIIRYCGATPATIAIIKGVPCIGLNAKDLEYLAKRGTQVRKVSRRDVPYVIAQKLDGATTVSGTMLLAARAGIEVFVTGGIGGVHRGGETTLDISSDLTELGRTELMVVCAGVKSVLDIPRTLEYLETQGVCVACYGSDDFPAFFTRISGCTAPCRVDTATEAASLHIASKRLKLGSGTLIAVPIPTEYAAQGEKIESAIQISLREAEEQHVTGNQITPFVLERIRSLTGGRSLEANIQLVKNNARVGAGIAVALAATAVRSKL